MIVRKLGPTVQFNAEGSDWLAQRVVPRELAHTPARSLDKSGNTHSSLPLRNKRVINLQVFTHMAHV